MNNQTPNTLPPTHPLIRRYPKLALPDLIPIDNRFYDDPKRLTFEYASLTVELLYNTPHESTLPRYTFLKLLLDHNLIVHVDELTFQAVHPIKRSLAARFQAQYNSWGTIYQIIYDIIARLQVLKLVRTKTGRYLSPWAKYLEPERYEQEITNDTYIQSLYGQKE